MQRIYITDTNKMRKVFNSPLIKNPNKFEGAYREKKMWENMKGLRCKS